MLFSLILFVTAQALPTPKAGQLIDLTHSFANGYTVQWPSANSYDLTIVSRGDNGNFWYESNDLFQSEHSGTHTDAPAHFAQGKWRMSDIPVERLVGPGIVLDISEKVKSNRDSQLTVEDLEHWESENGKIPEGAVVIMYSGLGKYYGNRTAYFGWPVGMEESNPKDTANLHFPGFAPEAAEWIVSNRNIHGTGVDTPSVDYGQSFDFKTHRIFGAKNIWGLENLNSVDKLPPKGFTIYNMAYKSTEGSGGPSRVIAVLNSSFVSTPNVLVILILCLLNL